MSYQLRNHVFINTDSISQQSLNLIDLGLEFRKNETYCFSNSSREYQGYLFQYTLDGYGIYESQGTEYTLSKGKAFFITFPDDSKYYLPSNHSSSDHWTYFYIHFSGPAALPFFHRIQELTGSVIELDSNSVPIELFFELYDALPLQQQTDHYHDSEWLYRFLIALLRTIEFPPSRKSSPHIDTAIQWIRQNYSKQINLAELSKEVGITYYHLSRQFCKEQGITPIQFLTNIRVEHGKELLLNTDLPIEKIAEECGFSCANYFTKVYKKVLHTSPSEYRKRHKMK